MAKMLPDSPLGSVSKSTAKLWSLLKRIQSDDLECRLSFPIDEVQRPEFLVIYQRRHVFLIAVSDASTETLEDSIQGNLFNGQTQTRQLGIRERHSLESYIDLIRNDLNLRDPEDRSIRKWIVFPNASSRAIHQLSEIPAWKHYLLLGNEDCVSERLLVRFEEMSDNAIDSVFLNLLKAKFNPEVAIPENWVGNKSNANHANEAIQTDFFLDFDQEAAVKKDLELSAEAEHATRANSLRLITGVAGCGKTLVLLFRARLSAKLNLNSRVLVLTHNKPLRADLEMRSLELEPGINVEWKTFYGWIWEHMDFEILKDWEKRTLIRNIMGNHPPAEGLTDTFVEEEFNWIADNAIQSPTAEWYLRVERTGRQRALQKIQRAIIFKWYLEFHSALRERGQLDWASVPAIFLKKLRSGTSALTRYDSILIDEAQFFAPVWFECVKHALAKEHGTLFMVADPTQGFLRNGQSWNQVLGREVRGRSSRLEKPYRNTKALMTFAKNFYLSRIPVEDGEVNLPQDDIINKMAPGDPPQFRKTHSNQDERTVIVNEVLSAMDAGLNPGSILVIHGSTPQKEEILKDLERRCPNKSTVAEFANSREKVRICSINACTGLEAQVVLIAGLDKLFETEEDLGRDELARAEIVRSNTKKVFVAITRATQKLLIFHSSEKTKSLLIEGLRAAKC